MTVYGVVKALSCRRSLRGKDSLKGFCKRGGRRKEGKGRKVDEGRIGIGVERRGMRGDLTSHNVCFMSIFVGCVVKKMFIRFFLLRMF